MNCSTCGSYMSYSGGCNGEWECGNSRCGKEGMGYNGKLDLISKLEWAINTIRDQLLFGRDELGAAKARELRAKGVLLDAVKEVKEMREDMNLLYNHYNDLSFEKMKELEIKYGLDVKEGSNEKNN